MIEKGNAIDLARIRSPRALPDNVYDALLQILMWGGLESGAHLSIDGLSKSLGVSPTPVREALVRLEHTGLVVRIARRGYRVAPPMTTEQMCELLEARRVIEVGALRGAMNHVEPLLAAMEIAHSRHTISAQKLARATPSEQPEALQQYFRDDWSFHQTILSHCDNRYLARSVESMSFSIHRMRQTIGAGESDAPAALDEHQRILSAVRDQDVEGAAAGLDSHLINIKLRIEATASGRSH